MMEEKLRILIGHKETDGEGGTETGGSIVIFLQEFRSGPE